ncbi:MAG: hypothetical protein V7642_2137, partial [Burkholderiales bacterium]
DPATACDACSRACASARRFRAACSCVNMSSAGAGFVDATSGSVTRGADFGAISCGVMVATGGFRTGFRFATRGAGVFSGSELADAGACARAGGLAGGARKTVTRPSPPGGTGLMTEVECSIKNQSPATCINRDRATPKMIDLRRLDAALQPGSSRVLRRLLC